ncbi:S-4TM family putative pore-forming effector [Curtobacterium sp. VKM Ac-1395]|uniref:S-4TM family putative pore-forming effector n=1 Tax=Curtobacterium sp. VKM Ac-1395 TaxID=2783815 RepID=UPI00188BA209|nr:S-4TM family putative pore-forming effector [Curtobacterium sp. VKM Ac-1395]MBF4592013.1 hypothetical protein [Curtobacterium sp. VKM Ac-1395]
MPLESQDLYTTQQGSKYIHLLAASTVASSWTQMWDAWRFGIACAAAAIGVAAAFLPELRPWSSVIGVVATIVTTFVLTRYRTAAARRSAVVQDQFDRGLFGLVWPSINPLALTAADLNDLARRNTQAQNSPWYANVTDIPSPAAETYCQREALLWDSELRTRWTRICVGVLIAVSAVELTAGVGMQLLLWQFILLLVVPTSSLLTLLATNVYHQQRNVARKKELAVGATKSLKQLYDDRSEQRVGLVRDALEARQQEIFALRSEGVRVPSWFYRLHQTVFESNHEFDAAAERARWAGWSRV